MQCLEIPHLKLDMVANSGQCFRMKALDADTYRVLVGKKQVDITPLGDLRQSFFLPFHQVGGQAVLGRQ